jgi:eukaryotic-like serine/threonine-protein kinase
VTPERWQQIARLFDEVFELEPPQRAAQLDAACAGDVALRREVEQMLAAHDRAGDFLNQDAAELEAAQLAAEQSALPAGHRIAHFEVLTPLGAGAMGEVYLARDNRLERQVALKLLPARFTQDAARLRRFEREARAASALNHPNIITVYEIGRDGEQRFIAAEFVAGVTLRERLADGPLPLAEAIAIATQIAAALEAAHAAGIVHRDIKPENVMLRADSAVKVLDFGIAKLLQANVAADNAAPSRKRSTEQGTVIGTPGYMSPEQARGLEVDARSDIFALGVVLYEMVAGRAPFDGATNADVIVALLEKEPEPLSAISTEATVALDEIVAKALAKDASQRYQSAEALRAALQFFEPERDSAQTLPRAAAVLKTKRARWAFPVLAVIGLLGVLLSGYLVWRYYERMNERNDWSNRAKLRFSTLFSTRLGQGGSSSPPSFSPDGKRIAFSLQGDEQSHIFVKELGSNAAAGKLTDGPVLDYEPIWSPDGQRLAYISRHKGSFEIRAVQYNGTQTLLKEVKPAEGNLVAWQRLGQGERIYYGSEGNFFALDPASGQVERLTRFDPQRPRNGLFRISPDGQRIIYREQRDDGFYLVLQPLNGAPVTFLKDNIRGLNWFPDGQRIAFISSRAGSPQAFIFWLDTRQIQQLTFDNEEYSAVVISPAGNALLAASSRDNSNIFSWDLGTSAEAEHTSEFGSQVRPEPSPDGKWLLFQIVNNLEPGSLSVFVKPLAPGGRALQLASRAYHARWSPDSETVAFARNAQGKTELWSVNANGKDERRLVTQITPSRLFPMPYLAQHTEYAWSPDGTKIAYGSRKSGQSNLWVIARDGTSDTNLTGNTDRNVTINFPVWSPDGQRLAYLTSTKAADQPGQINSVWLNEAGRNELLFQHSKWLHIAGWSASGRELLVFTGDRDEWTALQDATLLRLEVAGKKQAVVAKSAALKLPTVRLARDGRNLVVVSRKNGRDNFELISVNDGTIKRITNNPDPTMFYSSPTWAADGRSLFYSKQTSWRFIHLLEKQK